MVRFNVTGLKLLISLIAGIVIGLISYRSFQCFDCSKDVLFKTTLLPSAIIFIISALIIYITWSLIQNKN